MYSISSSGISESKKLLSELTKEMDTTISKVLHEVAEAVVAEAKSNLQNNTNINSGTLLASIKILDEGLMYVIIGTNEPYAGYIEYGRGPIKPKKQDGWLHWIDKDTGKDVFAKFAEATEPSPFLQPAVEVHINELPNILADVYKRRIKI